jgi:hypothetical protein
MAGTTSVSPIGFLAIALNHEATISMKNTAK